LPAAPTPHNSRRAAEALARVPAVTLYSADGHRRRERRSFSDLTIVKLFHTGVALSSTSFEASTETKPIPVLYPSGASTVIA
jgi:hypothetical protein